MKASYWLIINKMMHSTLLLLLRFHGIGWIEVISLNKAHTVFLMTVSYGCNNNWSKTLVNFTSRGITVKQKTPLHTAGHPSLLQPDAASSTHKLILPAFSSAFAAQSQWGCPITACYFAETMSGKETERNSTRKLSTGEKKRDF